MLNLLEAIKNNRDIKRKDWKNFLNPSVISLSKEDILSNDWEVEGQIWIKIKDFNIDYSLDNFGNLYSHRLEKLFTPKITKWGYYEVTLRNSIKAKSYLIHHLVAKYFLNHSDKNLVINHIDGNKKNNCVENLEIVTRSRNSKHAFELGLNKARTGEKSNLSKLTDKEVIEIKNLLKEDKLNQQEIGNKFNTTQANISRINKGFTWRHI